MEDSIKNIVTALLADDDSALKELFRAQVKDAVNQFLQNEMTAAKRVAVVSGQTLFYEYTVQSFIFLAVLDSLLIRITFKMILNGYYAGACLKCSSR